MDEKWKDTTDGDKKVKVSKKQFAEGLYYWLSINLTEDAIKEVAKDFDFKIRNDKDFSKLYEELLNLNM